MTEQPTYKDAERLDLPSASKFERLAACPGSRALEDAIPPQPQQVIADAKDDLAESGTIIHRARETGNTLELDTEQLELYEAGLKCEQALVDKWLASIGCERGQYREGPREERLWLNDEQTLAPLLSAKLDVHYLSGHQALALDWKTGFTQNLVGSRGNWQLRVQALLLKQEHPELTTIRVGFVKPRFETLDYTDYGEADLKYAYDSILLTLWWSKQPDAQRSPGQHCRWCPAKAHCPEAGAHALLPSVIARRVPDSGAMPWEMMVQQMAGPDLLRIYESSTIIEKIIEAVKQRLKSLPKEQLAELGLQLSEQGRKVNSIADVPGAYQHLSQFFLADDLFKGMKFSKAPLVELVQRDKGLSKAAAEAWLDKELDPFIARGFTAPLLQKLKTPKKLAA